jgi:rod shape-determining protein MreC
MVVSRRIRDIVLCLVLLGLPLVFLQANIKAQEQTNPIDRFLLRLSAPLQAAMTATAAGVHRGWRRYIHLVDVEQQNERLRAEVGRLRHALRDAQVSVDRVKRYERLLAFRAARGFETVGAHVIGRQSSPFARLLRLRIDRGKQIVRAGQPVVSADGIVGRVTRSFGGYSDVLLTVDPESAVDVIVRRSGARGVLRGIDGADRCRIKYLLRKADVKAGDLVVSTGSDGVYPQGVPVGRVAKVAEQTYGLYKEVEVTPVVDFASLEDVLVILAPPPPRVGGGARERQPARGIVP